MTYIITNAYEFIINQFETKFNAHYKTMKLNRLYLEKLWNDDWNDDSITIEQFSKFFTKHKLNLIIYLLTKSDADHKVIFESSVAKCSTYLNIRGLKLQLDNGIISIYKPITKVETIEVKVPDIPLNKVLPSPMIRNEDKKPKKYNVIKTDVKIPKKDETFREIKDYEKLYLVGNYGTVLFNKTTKIMTPMIRLSDGYEIVTMMYKFQRYERRICDLVAEAFIPNYNKDNVVSIIYKDDNMTNHHVLNLQIVLRQPEVPEVPKVLNETKKIILNEPLPIIPVAPVIEGEWKAIPENPMFEMNVDGVVRVVNTRTGSGRIIKPYNKSLTDVTQILELSKKKYTLHLMVAKLWKENPEYKRKVKHIDGDKTNNKASNLMYY